MTPDKWVWMPHPGHFICGFSCRFRLTTYVGRYIVSTVGELWPDRETRRIMAESKGVKISGIGDAWDADYSEKIGYEEIGYQRKYETMVFRAARAKDETASCCPWRQANGTNLDFMPYNDSGEAQRGHMKLCKKWAAKGRVKSPT